MAESEAALQQQSPFLNPGPVAKANTLAIIQLSKDDFLPVYLRDTDGEHDGYKEGHVLNTRFGSFPHSTLIGVPWGSQVRASIVDTGTRGRKKKAAAAQQPKVPGAPAVTNPPDTDGKAHTEGAGASAEGFKRKRDIADEGEKRGKSSAHCQAVTTTAGESTATERAAVEETPQPEVKAAQAPPANDEENNAVLRAETTPDKQANKPKNPPPAQSGFVHILPPTPEMWTTSLPHRTQVVYTPDYSYILQRIRARPGSRLIEAGSGSGSFTHASARAVYDGLPTSSTDPKKKAPTGHVFSFEFHEQRFEKMRREVQEHGLSSFVDVNHRDVYNEGFLIDSKSPGADAIFLDLPSPWLALPHLSRQKPKTVTGTDNMEGVEGAAAASEEEKPWVSPLNPKKSVYICTFSPCIEQVMRTVSEMRKLGWVEIDMVEISHKRMHVFREKLGLDLVSDRGSQLAPKNVAEALVKLREVEVESAEHNAKMANQHVRKKPKKNEDEDEDEDMEEQQQDATEAAAAQANGHNVIVEEERRSASANPSMQGQLVTRAEPELKAHTSYLVFAILPREWTEEDEAAAAAKWPTGDEPRIIAAVDRESRKQLKREQLLNRGKKNKKKAAADKNKDKAEGTKAEETKAVDNETVNDDKMEGVVETEAKTEASCAE